MTAAEVARVLSGFSYLVVAEVDLQVGVLMALTRAGITFEREVCLSRGRADRIDFLVGAVGIECKVDGSLQEVTRQLHRYAQDPAVAELVLVTTRARHAAVPRSLAGKPVHVVATRGGLR